MFCDSFRDVVQSKPSISNSPAEIHIFKPQREKALIQSAQFLPYRAYELQDQGADTVEANEALGFDSDLRSYLLPGAILRHFGLKAVRLLSNNPEKVAAVENAGVEVTERVPC